MFFQKIVDLGRQESLAFKAGQLVFYIFFFLQISPIPLFRSQSKGVKVTVEESNALIEVEISVKFGINIKKVCEEVQAKVKNAVETMTGLTVSGVNVIVSDVWAEKEKQVPAAEEMDEETKAE